MGEGRKVIRDTSRIIIVLEGSKLGHDIKFDGIRCFLMTGGMDAGMSRQGATGRLTSISRPGEHRHQICFVKL